VCRKNKVELRDLVSSPRNKFGCDLARDVRTLGRTGKTIRRTERSVNGRGVRKSRPEHTTANENEDLSYLSHDFPLPKHAQTAEKVIILPRETFCAPLAESVRWRSAGSCGATVHNDSSKTP